MRLIKVCKLVGDYVVAKIVNRKLCNTIFTDRTELIKRLDVELNRAKRHGLRISVVVIKFDMTDEMHRYKIKDKFHNHLYKLFANNKRPYDIAGIYDDDTFLMFYTHLIPDVIPHIIDRVKDIIEETKFVYISKEYKIKTNIVYTELVPKTVDKFKDVLEETFNKLKA